jgi:N-acetylglucosamine-6-sulfatase
MEGAGHRYTQRRSRRSIVVLAALLSLQLLSLLEPAQQRADAQTARQPNIVLILTDDQRWDTLKVMPEVQQGLVAEGMNLRRAIITNPLCCPSRATILTGRYAHTTGVYTNEPPNGGWSAFRSSESDTIATALHGAGYRTGLVGKYLNGFTGPDVAVPPGWDRFFAFTGPVGYYDYQVLDDKRGPLSYGSSPKEYSTDVFRRQAVSFIRTAPSDEPIFLLVAPLAPHGPSTPAPRHVGDLAGTPVVFNPAVNEDVTDKPAYLASRAPLSEKMLRTRIRSQRETLLAVDQLVAGILTALSETSRADDTLIIFMSDNGLADGEHRWMPKQVPYEGSIRVPMVVRLPGRIPAGTVSNALVSNVDIAPTIADFAGVGLAADGISMRPLLTDEASTIRSSVVLEHVQWDTSVPTYCGVRTPGFKFTHYVTGEEELYDLVGDPHELQNVVATRPQKAAELRALTRSLCQPVPPGFSW